MSIKYLINNWLYRVVPGGIGYNRTLSKLKREDYVHERDKHPVRDKHHGDSGWSQEAKDGIRSREYENYEEYLTHQKQKFDECIKLNGGFTPAVILEYRQKFYRRFKHLDQYIGTGANILYCGGRQGTEVEVLRDLGYHKAFGIDLNPGPDNPLVVEGDFMKIQQNDGALDLLYTNCVDHAFDLDGFFKEHARVIKDDGYVLYDICQHDGGAFEAVSWDSDAELIHLMLKHFKSIIHVESEYGWRWFLLKGKANANS